MRSWLVLAVAAGPALARPAPAPRDADAFCRTHEHKRFAVDKDRDRSWSPVTDEPVPENERKTYRVEWTGKLDPDKRADVILDEGDCGTRECIRAALVQCSDGSYAEVYSGYASSLEVVPAKSGWAALRIEHSGERDLQGHHAVSWVKTVLGADGYSER